MRLNNLSGKSWAKLTKSVWVSRKLLAWSSGVSLKLDSNFLLTKRKTEVIGMGGRVSDESMVKLIELFTKEGECVFDPLAQQGIVLKSALSVNRKFVGISENKRQRSVLIESLPPRLKTQFYCILNNESVGSSLDLIKNHSCNFLMTEVKRFNFSDEDRYASEIHFICNSAKSWAEKLKQGAYMALIVNDQQVKDKYYCRHSDIINVMKGSGLQLKGLINLIEDSQALKANGYPSSYVPNIINRFVIIFRC